jgi:hypothetical protein
MANVLASTTETNELVIYVTVIGPPQVKETGSFTFTLTTSSGDSIATGTTTIPSSSITQGLFLHLFFHMYLEQVLLFKQLLNGRLDLHWITN